MNIPNHKRNHAFSTSNWVGHRLAPVVATLLLAAHCHGQGTLTFTFEGQPVGTAAQLGFEQSGMQFHSVAPGTTYLSGGGVAGYPDNGTGYLYTPDSGIWFGFTNVLPLKVFNFVSFDAAEYAGLGPTT